MLIVERQQRVLAILRDRKVAELDELADQLEVSASTIRRDLDALASKGLVERTHGGAVYLGGETTSTTTSPNLMDSPLTTHASDGSTDTTLAGPNGNTSNQTNGNGIANVGNPVLAERLNEQVEGKQAIGKLAASMVQPHMTLLLDGGSTVIYAAKLITARPLQIVTNSLAIANLFAEDDQVELLLIGGNLYPRTGVLVGAIATGCLADLYADITMFSLAGIYDDAAFNLNLPMAQVEQQMIRQATRSILLMDSSKFGRKSLVRVCGLNEVDQIITDNAIDDQWQQRLGERLVVAEG